MKKLSTIITLVLILMVQTATNAQNWNEWFKQKKTQREYLVKQIVLLKTYLGYVKKGVTVVRHGLNTIENIKNGDFNLHRDFFSELKNVNPHISNSAKVTDIIAFQVFIIQELRHVNSFCRSNNNFTPEEIRYVADVYANMIVLCDASLAELLMIIKPDKTEMKDDERLKRIDLLYEDVMDKHAFVQTFKQDARFIAHEREREYREINTMKGYNDL